MSNYRMKLERPDRDVALIGMMYPEGRIAMPWPMLRVPPFTPTQARGGWKLEQHSHPGWKVRGYFSPGYQPFPTNWTLSYGDTVWMSVTPMELESQAHHIFAAYGTVLIGGLGMGVAAWNAAQKPEVTRVIVVEVNPYVIDLVNEQARLGSWANWGKVEFHEFDMLKYAATGIDVALIDIWPTVGDMRLRDDMQQISRTVLAEQYGAWGMEHDFMTWCMEKKIRPSAIASHHWRDYSAALGLPLIMQENDRMPLLAFQAVINGMKHEADKLMGGPRG
jgi:hypothetical protein